MLDKLPPDLAQALKSGVVTFILAWLGRLMWHVREVQNQNRRFWSLHIVWETCTALAIGFIADGIASYFGFSGKPAIAVIIVVAYLGPRGMENLIVLALQKYNKSGGKV